MTDRSELLRPAEVAEMLSMSRSKVYALVAAGRLPAVRAMGSVRVPRRALSAWIVQNTEGPSIEGPGFYDDKGATAEGGR